MLMRGTGAWLAVVAAALAPLPAWTAPPRAQVDQLLAMLQAAPDEASARLIEERLHSLWRAAGSPAARMLLDHGVKAIQGNAPDAAAADLDAAVTLDPSYAEAYSDRAAAHLMQGDYAAAIRDAGDALRQEPGHFAALQILSQIAQARGDWKGALEAWQRVLALDPHTQDAQTRLNLLRRNAEGEAT